MTEWAWCSSNSHYLWNLSRFDAGIGFLIWRSTYRSLPPLNLDILRSRNCIFLQENEIKKLAQMFEASFDYFFTISLQYFLVFFFFHREDNWFSSYRISRSLCACCSSAWVFPLDWSRPSGSSWPTGWDRHRSVLPRRWTASDRLPRADTCRICSW